MANYFWTKVWGATTDPEHDALVFNSRAYRDRALEMLAPGDIVVYLTSNRTEADPMLRGRVAGAIEIECHPVMAEDIGLIERARDVDFREDGTFRWPYGISITRAWRVLDQESNDNLIPDHAAKGLQGAMIIHEMTAPQILRFSSLRVEEHFAGGMVSEPQPFSLSLRRPWRQKAGMRSAAEVSPGSDLYVAVIADSHGVTFKIGSGKSVERLTALNMYRRPSQGETLWALSKGMVYYFDHVDAARTAEDHLIAALRRGGFLSPDHAEFAVKVSLTQLRDMFSDAVTFAFSVHEASEEQR